jgi:hypothetical protein
VVPKLSYANVTATVALFLSLGGVSYAAVHLGKGSVGTAQLKREAVSIAKIRKGAITSVKLAQGSITSAKIADDAVTGAKVNTETLGTVPAAVHAAEANHAARASRANKAGAADLAEYLDGFQASSFGPILTAHTEIPATTTDADWWVPVSGVGQASHDQRDVQMLLPASVKLAASQFAAFSWVGPNREDAAKVDVQLEDLFQPVGPSLSVTRIVEEQWTSSNPESPLLGMLAVHVREKANGEEIPAIQLQTALRMVPMNSEQSVHLLHGVSMSNSRSAFFRESGPLASITKHN